MTGCPVPCSSEPGPSFRENSVAQGRSQVSSHPIGSLAKPRLGALSVERGTVTAVPSGPAEPFTR